MLEIYNIGVGIVVLSILIILISIIIYLTNTTVHTWIFWVISALFVLLFFGLFLILLHSQYNNDKYNYDRTEIKNEIL